MTSPAQRIRGLLPQGAPWALADQASSALSNVVVPLALARSGAEVVGAFHIAFTVQVIWAGLARQLLVDPFLTLEAGHQPQSSERRYLATGVIGSAAVGAAILGFGLLIGVEAVALMGGLLPLVSFHEFARLATYRRGVHREAAVANLLWLFGIVASWPLLIEASATMAVALWAGASALGSAALVVRLRLRLSRPAHAWDWWRAHAQRVGSLFAAAGVANVLSVQALIPALAILLSTTDVGVLRASQILVAPVFLLQTAAGNLALPRLAARQRALPDRIGAKGAGIAAGVTASYGAILLVFRKPLARTLLGNTELAPAEVVAPLAVAAVAGAAAWWFVILLRAERRGLSVAVTHWTSLPLGAVAVLGLGGQYGLGGAAVGYVFQGTFLAVAVGLAWYVRRRNGENARTNAQ